MTTPSIVSAERGVECAVAGAVWQADIIATSYTSGDHTLRVDARLLRLTPGPKEQWHLWFADCAAHQLLPAGAPGNAPLTRPVKQSAFDLSSGVIYEIVDSEWLKSCQPVGGAPGDLHHFVVVDDEQNLALHVAATNVFGHRLEEQDTVGEALEAARSVARPQGVGMAAVGSEA
jgi:hypothetical protein